MNTYSHYIVLDRNFGNSLGQIRSLGEMGVKPVLIWVGNKNLVPNDSKYLSDTILMDSIDDGIDYMIEHYSNMPSKVYISTGTDAIVEALDMNYERLKDSFIFYNCACQGRLSHEMQKINLVKSAEECGFKVPESEIVRVGTLPSKLKYPILTKAVDSTNPLWKTYVHICKDEQELKLVYSKMEENQNILLQEYIEKKNEFILQGIVISGNVSNNGREEFIATYGDTELCIPIQGSYLRLQDGAYGSYLYFEKYNNGKKMLQKLCELFNKIGYSGIFEIEFLVNNNDELIFLEINFRHTLWNHTFTDMGCNLCKLWAESAITGL